MQVVLSGYYGFGNVGDEAILKSIVQGLRERDPGIEILVLSAFPKITREQYQVHAVHRYSWFEVLGAVLKGDIFVSGGGTLFQNATSRRSFIYYIGLVLLAKLLRKRVMIFAQGFGPLRGRLFQGLAKLVLNRVDLITLRDKGAYEEVKRIGIKRPPVYVTGDSTAILKIPAEGDGKKILSLEGIKKGSRPLAGIALRSLPGKKAARLYETLAGLIDWIAEKHGFLPVFVLFQCAEDMQEASKVIGLMKHNSSVIFRVCTPDEMLSIISQFDFLIGMRLHSLIFAAMGAVPMLGLSYDPKVEAFMRSIGQPCLKLDPAVSFEDMKDTLEPVLCDLKKVKAGLAAKAQELRRQAEMNFDLFFEHFKGSL